MASYLGQYEALRAKGYTGSVDDMMRAYIVATVGQGNASTERDFWLAMGGTGTTVDDARASAVRSAGGIAQWWKAGGGVSALAPLKAAALAAPTPGNLQYQAQTVTYLGSNGNPDAPATRHYFSGAGGQGVADLATVANISYWSDIGRNLGFTNNENDGSSQDFWHTGKDVSPTVQNSSPMYLGFQTPSQRLWVPSISSRKMQVRVDGKLLPANAAVVWPSNNNMAKIDFGSTAAGAGRKIVLQTSGDPWFSEVNVDSGSAIIPYNWMTDANKIAASFMTDSYGQGEDYSLVGLPFLQYIAELCGFGAITTSSIGGTGYVKIDVGDPTQYPNFQSATRLAVMAKAGARVKFVQGGINDPAGAATGTAMSTVLSALRAQDANALIVAQTSWAPNQTNGQNPAGTAQDLRTRLYAAMAALSGPWILIDNLAGQWSTSKGTNSGAGTGPWQTGDGYVGNTTGIGNGDTWVSSDGTHPTALGFKNLAELVAAYYKAALASM